MYVHGRVILIRNALHVPVLQAPLYSLRKHCKQPGCGIYGQEGIGSFIIFPSFTLQIDDTNDNIVSFRPISSTMQSLALKLCLRATHLPVPFMSFLMIQHRQHPSVTKSRHHSRQSNPSHQSLKTKSLNPHVSP